MAGLITHYICADAVLGKIDTSARKIIEKNRNLYNIGAQGPDIFFYYLPGFLKKSVRGLGSKMHKGNFKAFLRELCALLPTADAKTREEVFAYISGYLTHYAMDCAVHPYIYYRSGFKREGRRIGGIKYSVNHRRVETNIDVLMLLIFSGEKPAQKKLWRLIYTKKREVIGLADLLSIAVNKAYSVDIKPQNICAAFRYMCFCTGILQSKNGNRKMLLELVETNSIGEHIVSSLIHPQIAEADYDFLNAQHNPWCLPWDKTAKRTDSVGEMFEAAVTSATEMLNAFWLFFNGDKTLENLLNITGDKSFASGIESTQNAVFKYHKIIFKDRQKRNEEKT